jgi:hypothetical protein
MYDNSQRSMWLEQGYIAICKQFGFEAKQILIGASYPPAGARGALERVRPADFDTQWSGNDNEKDGFLSIHPMSFRSPLDALKAMLWAMARANCGVRRGASRVGLHKEPDATITADPETQSKLKSILAEIGDPPAGFAEPFPVRKVSRSRMISYRCSCASAPAIHTSTSTLQATCGVCQTAYFRVK